jgi:hypothetical protein
LTLVEVWVLQVHVKLYQPSQGPWRLKVV